jgi:hypothetical protein
MGELLNFLYRFAAICNKISMEDPVAGVELQSVQFQRILQRFLDE